MTNYLMLVALGNGLKMSISHYANGQREVITIIYANGYQGTEVNL